METFRESIDIGEFESCADSLPCLSHVDGDAVGVKLEPEVDAVAALHGAGRARQAVAPEAGVGAAPTAALHRRRNDIVRAVLKRIKVRANFTRAGVFLISLPLHSLQQILSF